MISFSKSTARSAETTTAQTKGELDLDALDTASGGANSKPTYYQMGGDWYIVTHDKHGKATGVTNLGPCG